MNYVSENFSVLQDYLWRKKTRYQTNDKPGGDMSTGSPVGSYLLSTL